MGSRHHLLSTSRVGAGVSIVVAIAIAMAMFGLMPPMPVRAAGVIYVKPGGAGLRDGSSWGNARDLAPALDAAVSGNELWVAAGSYKPTTANSDVRMATFQLKDGVAIYGGFVGSETELSQRNWSAHVVILSGELGISGEADNTYHVVTGASGATLNGVTITAGNADNNVWPHFFGGGMYNGSSSPALANVIFSANYAAAGGGGMYNNETSSPTLTNVTFSGNNAGKGGGMYNNETSSPTLTNTTFSGNSALADGGGMYNKDSSPVLSHVTFSSNSATDGGGMYTTTITTTSSPALSNVIFIGNSASGSGGGMYTIFDSAPSLTNVTLSGNSAAIGGGGIYNVSSSPQIRNSVIWGNTAPSGAGVANTGTTVPTISYSLVEGSGGSAWNGTAGTNGGHNLDENPLFVAAVPTAPSTHVSVRLQAASPAVNTGDSTGIVGTDLDLDGKPRIIGASVDMGAYERQPAGVRYVNYAATGSGSGYSWADAITTLHEALAFAGSGDELWVAKGSYTPGTSRSDTFLLRAGTAVYGGFAGTEETRSARNWTTNGVTLSGDIGTADTSDNVYHVVTGAAGATLDGVTISKGNANLAPNDKGGGIYNPATNLTLANLIVTSNSAVYGGGIYNDGGSAALTSVTISSNNATTDGGGMYNATGSATLSSVTFSSNSALTSGGGIYNASSNPTLTNVTFTTNGAPSGGGIYNTSSAPTLTSVTFTTNAATNGGGIYNSSSNPTLTSVTFTGNSATTSGGGIYNDTSAPTLTSVTINSNTAAVSGGGIYNVTSPPTLSGVTLRGNSASSGGGIYNNASSPMLKNMIISGNKATTSSGGGIYNSASSPTLRHVTISGNSAGGSGGGMYNASGSNPGIGNSIIWGNLASSGSAISNDASVPFIRNSLVQGSGGSSAWNGAFGTNNGGNLDTDPLFITAVPTAPSTGGNLQLHATSPAVNAGLNTLLPIDLTSDLAGNPRIVGGTVDMGAYEVQNPALLSITRAGETNPTNAASVSFKLTFTMPVSGVDAADFTLTTSGGQGGATLGTLSSSGSTWTVAVNTVDDQLGTIRLDLKGSNGIVSSDAPQMPISEPGSSGFSSGEVYTLDRVRPETTISSSPTSPNKNTSTTFSFSGSDSNTGVKSFECQIDGGGFSACTNTNSHTIDGLSHASHTFQVRAIDNVGNVDASPASYTWTVDTVPPTVSIGAPSSSLTNNIPVTFTVSYSDDQMGAISLKASDITLNSTGTTTGTLSVSGSGTSSRTVTISAISGDGTLSISLGAGTASDAAGNSAPAPASPSADVSVDNTKPTLSMSSVIGDPTNVASIPVTVAFSESVTSFAPADITLGNASISGFSGSGMSYSFTLTPLADGPVTAAIAAGAGLDAAGNPNTAATTFSRIYDNSPLAMSVTSTTTEITNASPILVHIHFGKPVDPSKGDFSLADLSITTGSADIGNFSGSGTSYSFEITPTVEGEPITVQVADLAARDAANNPSSLHLFTRTYDSHAPIGQSLVDADPPTKDTTGYEFTVVLSDNLGIELISLGDGDVTVTTPRGSTITASFVSYNEQPDKTVLATFSIPAPGGTWESGDNGVYAVTLAATSVYDLAGNAAAATNLGEFTVALECKVFLPSVMKKL